MGKASTDTPRSKLRIRYEHVVLTGSKQLRLDVAPPASTDTINDMAATLLWGPANAAVDNSETLRRVRIHCHKLAQALKAKEDRPAAAGYSLPSRPEKLAADMLVAWLLLRGRALQHMGRVWEALLMFKLLLTLQAIAPRSSWAPFVAHYHIAEIITNYEVCELNPHKVRNALVLVCVVLRADKYCADGSRASGAGLRVDARESHKHHQLCLGISGFNTRASCQLVCFEIKLKYHGDYILSTFTNNT